VRRSIQIALLIMAALAAFSVVAGPASAKPKAGAKTTPCWQTLIDDWYDGRIDSVYPIACYRAALEHQPEDVANYSSLGDDINRALAAAIAAQKGGGGTTGGGTTGGTGNGGSSNNGGSTSSSTSSGKSSTFHGGPSSQRSAAGIAGRNEPGGPLPSLIGAGANDASSVPIPLIVLGALALLLLALGSAGFVARRLQQRKPRPQPKT
jgi:hypothetical protein